MAGVKIADRAVSGSLASELRHVGDGYLIHAVCGYSTRRHFDPWTESRRGADRPARLIEPSAESSNP